MDKIPPQAIDIERAILGALLLDKECQDVIDNIKPEMFYDDKHVVIFQKIKALYDAKDSIDILTVSDGITSISPSYITQLTANIGSGSHIGEHFAILVQKYIQREILKRCYRLYEGQFEDKDIDETLSELSKLIEDVNSIISTGSVIKSYNQLIEESLSLLDSRIINRQKGIKPGIPIPFNDLQDTLGGWQKEDLIYIAARPGMGKSAVSIWMAKEAAKAGFKALFFSLEMSDVAIIDRAMLGETEIDPDSWKLGTVSDFDIQKVNELKRDIDLYVVDKSAIRCTEINGICRKERPDIIFIDYIQLMTPERELGNRNLELGEISHRLKGIAKEFKIPVVAMAQLNRDVEKRGDKRPILSDLRDSGELEQDADIVIMLFRHGFYSEDPNNLIELNVCKHRNGRTGRLFISHNRYMNNFKDAENIPF